jgi:hypothetical protein
MRESGTTFTRKHSYKVFAKP